MGVFGILQRLIQKKIIAVASRRCQTRPSHPLPAAQHLPQGSAGSCLSTDTPHPFFCPVLGLFSLYRRREQPWVGTGSVLCPWHIPKVPRAEQGAAPIPKIRGNPPPQINTTQTAPPFLGILYLIFLGIFI